MPSRIAPSTELSTRSGIQSFCTDRKVGNYPSRASCLDLSMPRPPGVAAISLAALTSRITPRLSTLVPQLRKAAEDLSREYAQKDAA